jgi:hypothetical protein
MCLSREYRNYRLKDVAASPHFRALYDTVHSDDSQKDPSCLVFEWMDHDLRSVIAPELRSRPILPQVVSRAVLSALDVLKSLHGVHTGNSRQEQSRTFDSSKQMLTQITYTSLTLMGTLRSPNSETSGIVGALKTLTPIRANHMMQWSRMVP